MNITSLGIFIARKFIDNTNTLFYFILNSYNISQIFYKKFARLSIINSILKMTGAQILKIKK
jgi:hypothetical protein